MLLQEDNRREYDDEEIMKNNIIEIQDREIYVMGNIHGEFHEAYTRNAQTFIKEVKDLLIE